MSKLDSASFLYAVLIVEADNQVADKLIPWLECDFRWVVRARNTEQAFNYCQRYQFDLIVIDRQLLASWLELRSRSAYQFSSFIVIGVETTPQDVIATMRAGGCDFLIKPINETQIKEAVERWKAGTGTPCLVMNKRSDFSDNSLLLGNSEMIRGLRETLQRLSEVASAILVEGETGVGKSLVVKQLAQQTANLSQCITVDCHHLDASTLMKKINELMTSESISNQSTSMLILDNIDQLSRQAQEMLLQFISQQSLAYRVRIISICQSSLFESVKKSIFRQDLYYRLGVIKIVVPPLRQRKDDIVLLSRYFLHKILLKTNSEQNITTPFKLWNAADFNYLEQLEWPGNIRELNNVIEQCVVLGCKPQDIKYEEQSAKLSDYPISWNMKQTEKIHIQRVVAFYKGSRTNAAQHLGMSRKTLDRKFKEWDQKDD